MEAEEVAGRPDRRESQAAGPEEEVDGIAQRAAQPATASKSTRQGGGEGHTGCSASRTMGATSATRSRRLSSPDSSCVMPAARTSSARIEDSSRKFDRALPTV